MKKFLVLAAALAFLASGAYAQVTMSLGAALGSAEAKGDGVDNLKGDVGFGGNFYLDYLLPISVPLSLGAEIGVDTSTFKDDNSSQYDVTAIAIPILLRVAYHLDLHPQLDLYGVGKIGYAFGSLKSDFLTDMKAEGGFAFGIDIGVAFYFTQLVGLFAEAGFDQYNGKFTQDNFTIEVPFNRFFTAGLSIKL
ncbi:hypothetical protein FACS189485_00700 [Spirochaetia bacterium]|nr:hypothetical protein FACS189485_00700 [Spirochaetia bacterium]